MTAPQPIRCRQILDADIPAVAALLARGFPGRSESYWSAGLARLAARAVPDGLPRVGFLLEAGGSPVGALLLIFSRTAESGRLRCNLSSWYVDPRYRSHAALLGMVPLRYRAATFLNISAAPNTWPIIEAQGFRRYTAGQVVACPALARSEAGLTVASFQDDGSLPAAEARLLADHAACGCLSLVGRSPDGAHPFVLMPMRGLRGRLPLPAAQLVYCRSLDAVRRFAGPIGRFLLARGRPLLVLDADAPLSGLPGVFWRDRARKYCKGPETPRLGDLAYTEFVLFGA